MMLGSLCPGWVRLDGDNFSYVLISAIIPGASPGIMLLASDGKIPGDARGNECVAQGVIGFESRIS